MILSVKYFRDFYFYFCIHFLLPSLAFLLVLANPFLYLFLIPNSRFRISSQPPNNEHVFACVSPCASPRCGELVPAPPAGVAFQGNATSLRFYLNSELYNSAEAMRRSRAAWSACVVPRERVWRT